MRNSVARYWRVLCLFALLLPLTPLPVTAQDASLSGVRNRIYESPSWGFTLVWDDAIWKPAESLSNNGWDRLELRSNASRLWIEAVPRNLTARQCADQSFDDLMARDGEHTVIAAPDFEWTTGQTSYVDDQGTERAFIWDVSCFESDPLPYLIRYTHYAWTDHFDPLSEQATLVIESVQEPVDGWDASAPERTQGVLDIREAVELDQPEWELTPANGLRFVTMRLTLENVDIHDTVFDASHLYIHAQSDSTLSNPIAGVVWLTGEGQPANPVITIPADGLAIGQVTFIVPADAEMPYICYQPEAICQVVIAELGGPVGSGSRPRIDPGR